MDDSPYTRLNSRPAWNVVQLIVVSFGFTGISTLHQFPQYLYTGSGAFLLPYFLCLIWLSIPVLYVQFRLGGVTGSNITGIISKHLPILKGISISCGLRLLYGAIVYHVQTAIALYYLYTFLSNPPSWALCDNSWNTNLCNSTSANLSDIIQETPESQFYRYHIVDASDGFFDTGSVIGHLAVAMLVVWIITFLLVAWGPRAYARLLVAPVAVGLLISFVLLGRMWSTTDDSLGSEFSDLLQRFYKPNWDELTNIDVWRYSLRNLISTMFLWLGLVPTLGKYSGPGNVLSRGGWFFILQAIVFIQHITVCIIVPFVTVQSSGNAIAYWNLYHYEHFMFVFVPVSLGMLPNELWPRAMTSLFYTYVVIFYMLSSVMVVFVVISMLVSGISGLSGPKSTWEKAPLFRPILAAVICFVSYLLGITFVSQSGYYWRILSDMIQDSFLFLFVFILAMALAISFVRETGNYVERVVIGVWFVIASVVCLTATLFDGKPWKLLDQYKLILETTMGGATHANNLPEDGDNVVAVSYTIALGPLVWGLIIGAIHTVVSYNGPSELKCSYFLTGWRSGNALGRGRAAEKTRLPPAENISPRLRNSTYPSLTTH